MIKKKFIILFTVVFLAVPFVAFGAGTKISALLAPHIQIVNSGKNIDVTDNPAIMYNNRTYVPLRAVSEAIGVNVEWDGTNNRIDLMEPQDDHAVIEKNGVKVVDYVAKPNVMKTFDIISGQQEGEIIYTISEKLDTQATATFLVLNQNNKIATYETIILKETAPGTYSQKFYTEYFHLPYKPETSNLGLYEEKMANDYSYRLNLN
ncbi:stalk domain-containing protein [Bacillus sp. Marseille-P3661]|uniref:stalk domain-containing protein n=1 Tax=Bacillus sp. Marseille-P3661 TaxID=1936234 RepID=UPI001CA48212|nr:stalk domain-containing protein [Bacillus sp. Marseille-P3661]